MAGTPQRTDINLEEFRKLLLKQRARLMALHQELRADIIAESHDSSENELSGYATFDRADNADSGAILADIERDSAFDENEKQLLRQVEHALARIEDGTYGICEVTGQPIPVARLRALPWATMTVEAAERYER
jgi:DnaK suppressor protein